MRSRPNKRTKTHVSAVPPCFAQLVSTTYSSISWRHGHVFMAAPK